MKDIHNVLEALKAKRKGGRSDMERTQEVLEEMCSSDPGSVACLFVGDGGIVETIAFQQRKMRRLFSAFPEVMMVDTTFNTNCNRYKLFSFVVMDIHGTVRAVPMLSQVNLMAHDF